MASKWRYGCGKSIKVFIPRGYSYREATVECGSTSIDGGVNQCDDCAQNQAMPPALEDEGDLEYDQRVMGGGE